MVVDKDDEVDQAVRGDVGIGGKDIAGQVAGLLDDIKLGRIEGEFGRTGPVATSYGAVIDAVYAPQHSVGARRYRWRTDPEQECQEYGYPESPCAHR